MKKIFAHIKQTIIAGLILLVPAFVLIVLLQKLHASMTGVEVRWQLYLESNLLVRYLLLQLLFWWQFSMPADYS